MAVNLSPIGGVAGQFFDNNGDPLTAGKIYTYAAGTTTPLQTYTSSTGSTPHANPIILDAAGRVPGGEIWLTDGAQYKFVIKTSTDVQIGSYDNIIGINSNFVNYTNSQEIQTATAGQTVFTLTTMQYQPGTNSLSVFVDGVNQYGPGALYAYDETSSTVVTFASGLHVGAQVKFVTSAINASSYGDAEQISYTAPYTGGVTTNVELKLAQTVSVKDFGAVGDGVTDDTAAFVAAQQASKYVWVPPGNYALTALRIYNGVNLIGAGYDNTIFTQKNAGQPAINCLSDAVTGQLLSLRLANFSVTGHPSATVAAVKFEALGVYAIYRSNFDFIIRNCYQAVNMQAYTANNIFYCSFKFDIVNTATTSVVINGGSYNVFDMFIAQVGNSRMLQHEGFGNVFRRLIGEGQIYCTGQSTTYISPTIEEILSAPPTPHAIYLNGFNQVLLSPNIILNASSSANVTYCIRPFSKSWIANPRFLVNGTPHPFDVVTGGVDFTLQGQGQNNCVNKMEALYVGSDATNDLRGVAKVGDVSAFMSAASTYNGATTQYLAPTTSFNVTIKNETDVLILEPTGVIPVAGIVLAYSGAVRKSGQRLTIYTSNAITSAVYNGNGSDVSLFPASYSAGQIFRAVYDAALNKWFPC